MKFYKTAILAVLLLSAAPSFAAVNRATLRERIRARLMAAISRFSGGPQKASTVQLASFTGTVKITKKDGTVVEVTSDGKTPAPTLNDGDQVTVVSGDATMKVGGNTAALKSGDAVTVSGNSITVVTGTIAVTGSNGTTQVAAGKSVSSQPAASVSSNNNSSNQQTTTNSNPKQEQQTTNSPSAP